MRRLAAGLTLALMLPLALGGAAARADASIERRLSALRSLGKKPPVPRATAPTQGGFACPVGRPPEPESLLRLRIDRAVRDASRRFAVDPALVRSVIHHESAGRPDAVSPKGAMGLMQLMPGTARELGVICPFDPRENILAGTRYLRRLHDQLGGWGLALAGYHAGARRAASGRLPPETRSYVGNVLYRWRYGH